jgi:hypothetical protein
MKTLDNVSLVIVDCVNYDRAKMSLDYCMKRVKFGEVKFLTDFDVVDPLIEKISKISSIEKYSEFIIKDLANYFTKDFVLVAQWDGFVRDANMWDDEFFKYDYIGAPWDPILLDSSVPKSYTVGNGGFSLRSKRLQEFLRDNHNNLIYHKFEDVSIGQINRAYLEENGFTFAPEELAKKFSLETGPMRDSFGCHGRFILEKPNSVKTNHIKNADSFTESADKRLNLTLDPFAFIFNTFAMGDVIAGVPVVKYMVDNYYTDPSWYRVVAKKAFRPLFPFVPDSSFRDFDSKDEVFWGISENFSASTLNTGSQGQLIRNTPKSMHLSHFSSLKFCDSIIPLEKLPYVPLAKVDVSKFNIDFTKSVILITTYRDVTRMWYSEEIIKVANWIKQRGLIPVFVGKTDMDLHLEKKSIIPKTSLPEDVAEYGVDLRNKTSMLELTSIIAQAKAICGVDSGPIHLAGTTSTPIICGYTTVGAEYRIPTRVNGKTYSITPNLECINCQSRWRANRWNFENCYFDHANCSKHLTADKYINILNSIV